MKKYIVRTDYDLGLLFSKKEDAIEVLEATPVRQNLNGRSWVIENREMSLLIVDDSKLIVEPEKDN